MSEPSVAALKEEDVIIRYQCYEGEEQLPLIMNLVDQELSEPYSIFTYRYFISLWPNLCFLAFHGDKCVGTIVCKMGQHRSTFRGYIAMLVVIKPYRGRGIATELVTRCIEVMRASGCDEVALEAEVTNKGALALYGNLGFIRAKRLDKYYLNGADAFRLKLQFPKVDLNDFDHRYAEEGCHSCSHEHHDHEHHQAHSHQHYHGHEHGGTCAHNHYHEYQSDQLHWHEHGYHNCHDHK